MKLIDANIFLYASGAEHRYKAPSTRILEMTDDGSLEATTDVEVFQEVIHILYSRDEREFGEKYVRQLLVAYSDALPVSMLTVSAAVGLLGQYPKLRTRDAIHAAVVIQNQLEGIISADRGFDMIAGLKRFDPIDLAA